MVYLGSALLVFGGLMWLGVFVEYDITLSALFYNPTLATPWFAENDAPWRWLYRYGEYPALLVAAASACVYLGSLRWQAWLRYRCMAAFLCLAIALGPGVLVNGLLKPIWNRPRPRQVELFGGARPYRPWWQPGGTSQGKSLPSGHAAMGYILVASICLVPASRQGWLRPLVFSSTLTYGTVLGYARIVQGGHFASDVLAAGGLMCGTVLVLYVVLPPCRPVLRQGPS